MTPNQARDNLLRTGVLSTEIVQGIRKMALKCAEQRKADGYNLCPRCKGYHSIQGNYDNLCDQCQRTILAHFPDHETVPHIKAALKKWTR